MHEKEEQLQDNQIKNKHHNYSTYWIPLRARRSNRMFPFVNMSQVNKHDYRSQLATFLPLSHLT